MDAPLSKTEREFIDEYIASAGRTVISPMLAFVYSTVVTLLGLLLATAAVFITVRDLHDRIVYWALLPGLVGGTLVIVFGFTLSRYFKKLEERKKVAEIVKKLLN